MYREGRGGRADDRPVRGLTGVPEGTLRMWERRYGFPSPQRLPSGHRRYSEDEVALVRRVASERSAGLSLTAAIDRVKEAAASPTPSVYASLRRHRPDLEPCPLRKPMLLALTRAIEDESLSRATARCCSRSFQSRALLPTGAGPLARAGSRRRAGRHVRRLRPAAEAPRRSGRGADRPQPPDGPRMDRGLLRRGSCRLPGRLGAAADEARCRRRPRVRDDLECRAAGRVGRRPGQRRDRDCQARRD